ncbi:hypothetical protein SAMN04487857_1243 [Pseudomonas sp. ok272]|uniref:hypothetical protein n=1 Tax=unclassified Pseudomonas TaxID=196821 RepID=UPI0008C139ED|nr:MULTISPECIES: hypothetical protein [unclassified Pseudomonas]SEN58348.1 hypothetical protein SAMN04487857_1243 [Pseudomonas sp. ok272]SFN38058.1 hypothetical protein SAMN04487858_12338 [Pseudomonas sp. ok602]
MKTGFVSLLFSTCLLAATFSGGATAQSAATKDPVISADNAVMLTVFLKHDQSRPLSELRAQIAKQEFYKVFPPAGVEVVSWNITMGIGQVIVLRFPASRLPAVNLAVENGAWGPYRTEFFPTYDFRAIAQAEQDKARQTPAGQ